MSKKKKKFEIDEFVKKDRKYKKNYIISESKKISNPKNIEKKLHKSYKYKEVLNKFIVDYINKIKINDPEDLKPGIKKKINEFKVNFLNHKLPELTNKEPTNLYQMSGAIDFAKINLILRSLSTSMGHLWENIATCSKLTISTEKEFDLKINGVDIIFIKEGKPFYAQIKTLEGTLTGSQVPRSESELSIHKNSYFVAAFKTGTSWTFNSDKIEKIVGEKFWSMIDLDYQFILDEVKTMIKEIEDGYHKTKLTKN